MSQQTLEKSEFSARVAKHIKVANMLGERILHGDYVLHEFPTHRDLAEDVGVSKVTARRAVDHLIDEGLLTRQANGRPTVYRQVDSGSRPATRSIAFLTEGYISPVLERWHRVIGKLAKKRNWSVRMVAYSHKDDPIVRQTLENFDGIFFSPGSLEPKDIINQLDNYSNKVVVLNRDWSSYNLRCLWLTAPSDIQILLNHLGELGHKRIACLNTQPIYDLMKKRIEQYQLWMAVYGDEPQLINKPVQPFEDPHRQAYEQMNQILDSGSFDATALFCVTAGAAKGAMRSFYERGIEVGKDIALCAAVDDGKQADLWCPSLTSIQEVDPKPYLDVCLDWFESADRQWHGPLLVQPATAPLFIGESTKNVKVG